MGSSHEKKLHSIMSWRVPCAGYVVGKLTRTSPRGFGQRTLKDAPAANPAALPQFRYLSMSGLVSDHSWLRGILPPVLGAAQTLHLQHRLPPKLANCRRGQSTVSEVFFRLAMANLHTVGPLLGLQSFNLCGLSTSRVCIHVGSARPIQ